MKTTTKAAATTAKAAVTTAANAPLNSTTKKSADISVNGYTKYDLLSDDTSKAAAAYEALSEQLWEELYGGKGFIRSYGLSNGYSECKVILAVLNHDKGISPEVLASDEALGGYSYEDVINYSHSLDFGVIEKEAGTRVDFTKYMLDEDFANFINATNDAWINYENGDEDEFLSISKEYYSNPNKSNYVKEVYLDYQSATWGPAEMQCLIYALEDFDKNIVIPLYNSYCDYI